jgi:nucleoside-diphosphate-sugar epimerase
MKIVVTGATGYVGSRVARRLIERGDQVTGVIRAPERATALPQGVAPLVADLSDAERIMQAAEGVDAVLHTGFASHGADWFAAVELERALIERLSAALAGSPTRLVVANGTAFYGDAPGLATEAQPIPASPFDIRAKATAAATTTPSLNGVELRLASFVHGHGGSIFVPALVKVARETGRSIYVGDGDNRLSAVHVDGAARAFVAAADRGSGVYHIASRERLTMRELAEGIAVGTRAVATSVSTEEAAALTDPFTASFLTLNNGLSAGRAARELGWSDDGDPTLLWEVREGSYAMP